MKKRASIILSIIMVLSVLLTACGANSGPATSSPSSSSPAASTEATPVPAKDVKLVYWTMWNETEPQGQVIAEAVEAYSKQTGVEVELNFNGRDIRKNLQPALDAGTQIDIFDEDVDRVNGTWGNYLLDMEAMASKSYPTTDGKPFTEVVNKALIDTARLIGPGSKLSSIPYQPFAFVVMYNKDIFNQAGITSTPNTWDELLAACEKIKAAGKTPWTVDDAYMAALVGYHMARTIGMDATLKIANENNWDNPGVLEFAKDWEEMYQKGYISANAGANVWPAGQQEVAQESVAMYLNGTWLPNEIKDSVKPDFKWGTFAYPAVSSSGDSTGFNNFGGQCFAINKASKNPQEAFDLIVTLTTGEFDSKLAKESLGVPMGTASDWPVQLAEAKNVFENTTDRYIWAVGMENSADVNAKIKTNFALLVSGKLDAQGFADAMKK